jgi:hypothetical protein
MPDAANLMASRAAKATTDPLMSLHREMGEVTAVARGIGHAVNGISQKVDGLDGKVDALALVVAAQGHLREDVARLEQSLAGAISEIATLKADKLRREGAIGLLAWMGRNWPGAFLGAVLAALVTFANGLLT